MSSLEGRIQKALENIILPKLGKNLIDAGMLERIEVVDGRARILLHFKPAYASKSQLRQWVNEQVSRIESVSGVEITFTQDVGSRHSAGPQRTIRPEARTARRIELPSVKETVAIFSGKGGVGKSTVSVNLAVALAQAGARVGLFDGDVHGPNIPNLLGIDERPMVARGKIQPIEKYGLKTISLGLLVEAEEALIWRGPMISKAINELLSGVEWGQLDYLIIDLPPGCLTADTLIFTDQGPTPMSEIEEGMYVYSFDGCLHKASYKSPLELRAALVKRKVLAVIPQGRAPVYELRTATRSITGTKDHPLLVLRRAKRQDSRFHHYSLQWTRLGALKPGDIILTIKMLPEGHGKPLKLPKPSSAGAVPSMPEYSSDDFMRLVGYFLGDGFVRTQNGKYWGVWFSEPEGGKYREKYVRLLKGLFGLAHIHQQPQKFAAISMQIAELFDKLGLHQKALGKRIPAWVFTLPASQRLALIEGYCDADGHRRTPRPKFRRAGWMAFESPNQQLMADLRALCIYTGLKVGNLVSRTRTVRLPSTGRLLARTFWTFEANRAAKTSLYGAGVIRGQVGRGLCHDYIGFERIKDVNFIGVEEVYDLQVDGEHNFVANGFIVHNTGDAQLGLAQDLELSGSIAVTTPQEVSLADVRRGITTFKRLEVPLWGIVENMSYFLCPHCGKPTEIFGSGGGEREAQRRGVPLLGKIPIDPAIREGGDRGVPIVTSAPDSVAAQEFRRIAQYLLQKQRQTI